MRAAGPAGDIHWFAMLELLAMVIAGLPGPPQGLGNFGLDVRISLLKSGQDMRMDLGSHGG